MELSVFSAFSEEPPCHTQVGYGVGLLRHELDMVSGAAWTPGSGGYGSFSVPVFIHSAHWLVMLSFSVYVIHHTVHTHTHTHTHRACTHKATTFVSSPGFYRSSAELDSAQVMSQGSLCGTVTQTVSSGSSKPFSGTLAQW